MVVQQEFEKGRSQRFQEIRSLQKLAIFFRVSRWGRRGGGACTRYFTVYTQCSASENKIKIQSMSYQQCNEGQVL